MTTPQDNGGPAFPVPPDQAYATSMSLRDGTAVCAAATSMSLRDGTAVCAAGTGMTLRDYFAAAALQGWLATYGEDTPHPGLDETNGKAYMKSIAECSYEMADAMLAARNAKQ